jgi:two-component system CheB/CheR fusion protein
MPETVPPPEGNQDQADQELARLLQKIYDERGFDFRDYKKESLKRRIRKRLDANHLSTYQEYMEFLDASQDEYSKLFDTMLINVTEFFRDPDAWKILESEVIPGIIAGKKNGESIRVWTAGCASGEEPYSVGILLAEALGDALSNFDVRIYATDIDENALAEARRGAYSPEKLKNVSPERLEKYFTKDGGAFKIDRHIRQMVAFGRQDLTSDAPISHLDLLICRNVLIYFNAKLQNKLLYRFDFAVNRGGYVFFGKSESTALGSRFFKAISQKWRIFQKTVSITELRPAERRLALIEEATVGQAVTESRKEITKLDFYNQAIINNISLALIVLDRTNIVTTWNYPAQEMWMIKADYALGRNFYEIGMGDRIPGINDALREAMKEKKKVGSMIKRSLLKRARS